jgi:hypothetical protein
MLLFIVVLRRWKNRCQVNQFVERSGNLKKSSESVTWIVFGLGMVFGVLIDEALKPQSLTSEQIRFFERSPLLSL